MTSSPDAAPARRQFLQRSTLLLSGVALAGTGITAHAANNAISVRDFGAKGDGRNDDTAAFRKAIAAVPASGTLNVPAGDYLLTAGTDPGSTVVLKSNMTLALQPGARLLTATNPSDTYYLLWIRAANNVTIIGSAGAGGALPQLVGDRASHAGSQGEHGMGIRVEGSSNVRISNLQIRDFWGDGIYVSGTIRKGAANVPSREITVSGVQCRNNRRQGMSIICVNGMKVTDSEFSGTQGTAPMDGIDIEPNRNDQVSNVTIQNCKLTDNRGHGLEVYGKQGQVANIAVIGCTMTGNWRSGFYGQYASQVQLLNNPAISDNGQIGAVFTDTVSNAIVRGNKFSNNLLRAGIKASPPAQFKGMRASAPAVTGTGECSSTRPTKGNVRHLATSSKIAGITVDGNTFC